MRAGKIHRPSLNFLGFSTKSPGPRFTLLHRPDSSAAKRKGRAGLFWQNTVLHSGLGWGVAVLARTGSLLVLLLGGSPSQSRFARQLPQRGSQGGGAAYCLVLNAKSYLPYLISVGQVAFLFLRRLGTQYALASPFGRGGTAKGRDGEGEPPAGDEPSQSPTATALPKGEPLAKAQSLLVLLLGSSPSQSRFARQLVPLFVA